MMLLPLSLFKEHQYTEIKPVCKSSSPFHRIIARVKDTLTDLLRSSGVQEPDVASLKSAKSSGGPPGKDPLLSHRSTLSAKSVPAPAQAEKQMPPPSLPGAKRAAPDSMQAEFPSSKRPAPERVVIAQTEKDEKSPIQTVAPPPERTHPETISSVPSKPQEEIQRAAEVAKYLLVAYNTQTSHFSLL